MLSYAHYFTYPEGKEVVEAFYNHMLFFCTKELHCCLDGYRRREGNALNDQQVAYFAGEFRPNHEEYFGDHGVAVYYYDPSADDLKITLMEEQEFFYELGRAIWRYSDRFSKAELEALQEAVDGLLSC